MEPERGKLDRFGRPFDPAGALRGPAREPDGCFRQDREFCRSVPSPQQLATAIELVSFKRLQQAESKFGFPEAFRPGQQFFRAGRSDQWRTALSEAQVRRIVVQHGFQMRQCGYQTEDLV